MAARKNRLGDLLDAQALECCHPDGEKFLCGADSRGENSCKHLGCETKDAVVQGFWCHESVMCIDVQCGNTCCFVTNFTAEGIVHKKGPKIEDLTVDS